MLADIETRICSEEMLEVFQIILKQRCLHSLSTREDRGVTFSRSLFWVVTSDINHQHCCELHCCN